MRDLVLDMAIGPVSLALDRSGGTLALYEGKGKERRNECNVKVRSEQEPSCEAESPYETEPYDTEASIRSARSPLFTIL